VPDLDLDAVLNVPVVYASGKAGVASTEQPADGELPESQDLEPLFATIMEHIPAPTYTEGEVLQAHVTNLDYSSFLGRLALLRVRNGTPNRNQTAAWSSENGINNVKITELLATPGPRRARALPQRCPEQHPDGCLVLRTRHQECYTYRAAGNQGPGPRTRRIRPPRRNRGRSRYRRNHDRRYAHRSQRSETPAPDH